MSHRRRRSALWTALAASSVLGGGLVLSLFSACSLASNGIGPGGVDATAGGDATSDADLDSAEASDLADANRGDGCATVESCLDGIDNDCNGLTDCADPACGAGFACAPDPAGSFGGFALYDDGRSLPCPTGYTQTDTFEALSFLPAECAPCACDANGTSCAAAVLTCSSGASCDPDGGGGVASFALGAGCTELDGGLALAPSVSCALGAPVATAGSCKASGGGATIAPATFAQLSRICTASGAQGSSGGGCGSGAVCVARPPAGSHGPCVAQVTDGAAVCPAGYPHAHVTAPSDQSFTDTRACTACSCAGPTGAACGGTATLYPGAGCGTDAGTEGGAPVTLSADGVCQARASAAPEQIAAASLEATVASEGSCAASGGHPSGTVTPKSQTVYCCQN